MEDYKNKKVLILGLGLNEGGVGSARFFASRGAEVLISDLKDEKTLAPSIEKLKDYPNIKYSLGAHKYEDIDWADLIIRNQALKPDNQFLEYAKRQGKKIDTDIGIFLGFVKKENIIGVTGTKGKSTTSSLIYETLRASNKKALLAGNIGKSVLDSLNLIEDNTLIVLEISSFQLESFDEKKISPKYAVITNIYPDHLNYYKSMEDYIQAKKLIAKNQFETDFLFINKNDEITTSKDFLSSIKSEIIFYEPSDLPKDFQPKLPGTHNLTNMAAALALSKVLNLDEKTSLEALKNFQGVEFRLQLIKEWNGIKIYNNTTATAPEPAIESLKTFPDCILIAGGMNKGLSYKEFADNIETYAKDVYFLAGDATDEMLTIKHNQPSSIIANHDPYQNLHDLLKDVKKAAKPGDVILFSPGATSFNLFQNEFDRGRKFNEVAEETFT